MCDNCNRQVPTQRYTIEGMAFEFCGENCKHEFTSEFNMIVNRLVSDITSWKSFKRVQERSYA